METKFDLEEYWMRYLQEQNLLDEIWSSFMETHEGQIYSQINTQERNRFELYHFLQTGTLTENEQDLSEINKCLTKENLTQ